MVLQNGSMSSSPRTSYMTTQSLRPSWDAQFLELGSPTGNDQNQLAHDVVLSCFELVLGSEAHPMSEITCAPRQKRVLENLCTNIVEALSVHQIISPSLLPLKCFTGLKICERCGAYFAPSLILMLSDPVQFSWSWKLTNVGKCFVYLYGFFNPSHFSALVRSLYVEICNGRYGISAV